MRGGMYHSGDLAYVDRDGYVHFAGRMGDWVPRRRRETSEPDRSSRSCCDTPTSDSRASRSRHRRRRRDRRHPWCQTPCLPSELSSFLAAQPDLGPKQWRAPCLRRRRAPDDRDLQGVATRDRRVAAGIRHGPSIAGTATYGENRGSGGGVRQGRGQPLDGAACTPRRGPSTRSATGVMAFIRPTICPAGIATTCGSSAAGDPRMASATSRFCRGIAAAQARPARPTRRSTSS